MNSVSFSNFAQYQSDFKEKDFLEMHKKEMRVLSVRKNPASTLKEKEERSLFTVNSVSNSLQSKYN